MGTFAYFPHTEEDIKVMLERIGVGSMDELYADVPAEFMRGSRAWLRKTPA